jgi:hypothetical protein
MKVRESIKQLLIFLQNKEVKNESISKQELLDVTGWKESTLITYLSKEQLSDFLHQVDEELYEASNVVGLTDIQFAKLLSQSKHRRELGHNCKSRLAKALLKKSRDNMLLALELYNRPSLENRLDGFVVCFCIAWEQLLKAILIEEQGENNIYKKNQKASRIRETISLHECLERKYTEKDLVRKNIEKVIFLRNQATHLLMEEAQGITSRVFQSGVSNYSEIFEAFTEFPFISASNSGILLLTGNLKSVSSAVLYSNYGKDVGKEVMSLIEDLEQEVKSVDDIRFAIPVGVRLVFEKKDSKGKTITLAKVEEGIEGLRKAIIVEKPIDRHHTHPFKQTNAVIEINKRLRGKFSDEILKKHLVATKKEDRRPEVRAYCFQALAWKLGWKKSDNDYHYENKDPSYHYFSEKAVDEFISKVMSRPGYLDKVRKDYNYSKRKKK